MREPSRTGVNRRTLLMLAATAIPVLRLYGDDGAKLLTNSPWAKPVTAQYQSGPQGSGANPPSGGGGRKSRDRTPAGQRGVVVWESAQPILEARDKPLPDALKDHYVLSVTGIAEGNGEPDLDQIKRFTTLQPKDKDVAQPDVILAMEGSPNGLLFGFSKDSVEFTHDDQEIQFTTWIGHLLVKARFETKDMVYKGKLAL